MSDLTFFQCDAVGVDGTTRVAVQRRPEGTYEARVGIALLGVTNVPIASLRDANPFDPDFPDNYARGEGATETAALEALKRSLRETANMLWEV